MGLVRTALLRASQSQWLSNQVRGRRFVRRAVSRFMPGEDLDSALQAAQRSVQQKMTTVLTQLGENVADANEARAVARHYTDVLNRIQALKLPAHISVKPTQLGLDLSRDLCLEQLTSLVAHAANVGTFVSIDMEGSAYVDRTLELYRKLRPHHPNVGVCLQAYLYRTPDDLDSLAPLLPTIRLVKGAYNEPASIAFPKKRDVDRRYLELAQRLLAATPRPPQPHGFGTHDGKLIQRICDHARSSGVPNSAFELQMLFGIRTADQARLAQAGYAMRVLVSYGSYWFPWYMRRLAERPANVWFVVKSMFA
ncbi:MAG: proline dehydrogenase family protein [Gemmatimonadetes bacterium]|nr:proline dehydrogenase family protein [Gemmatimonadota bacterium]